MANFLTGQTFAATEQVTNTKLNNAVNLASISNIQASELANNFLTSLVSASGKVQPQNLWRLGSVATNASLIDISTFTSVNLYYSTFGSLATFVNARIGQEILLIAQQASFPTILDAGNFKLASNWIPAGQYQNLKLVWDGNVFIEISRGTV